MILWLFPHTYIFLDCLLFRLDVDGVDGLVVVVIFLVAVGEHERVARSVAVVGCFDVASKTRTTIGTRRVSYLEEFFGACDAYGMVAHCSMRRPLRAHDTCIGSNGEVVVETVVGRDVAFVELVVDVREVEGLEEFVESVVDVDERSTLPPIPVLRSFPLVMMDVEGVVDDTGLSRRQVVRLDDGVDVFEIEGRPQSNVLVLLGVDR